LRRIVFAGNRQLQALCMLYRQFVAPANGDSAIWAAAAPGRPVRAGRHALESADIVVAQTGRTAGEAVAAPPGAQVLPVPLAAADFLWPFRAPAHPRNEGTWFLREGPYGEGMGDAWLNRRIAEGADPGAAAARYAALEMDAAGLDRMYEAGMQAQRERDAATGFGTAAVIEATFRDAPAFVTPVLPGIPVLLHLASELFARLDAPAEALARLRTLPVRLPFRPAEHPLHPAVIGHFGLRWASDRRWRFLSEGRFGFADWARRYMRCEWNPELEEGIALVSRGKPAEAEGKLRAGLARSPDSPWGRLAESRMLAAQQDADGALDAARKAAALEPDDGGIQTWLAELLARRGDLDAVPAYTRALELDPSNAALYESMARAFTRDGRPDQAVPMVRAALAINPFQARLHRHLGYVLTLSRDFAGAAEAYRRAIELDPAEPDAMIGLSRVLAWEGRVEEALAVAGRSLERAPDDARLRDHMAGLRAWEADQQDDRRIFEQALAAELERLRAGAAEQFLS
jgi:tetratricopeptide (TPR) repeat protein